MYLHVASTLGVAVVAGKYVYQYYGSQQVRRREINVSGYQAPQSGFMARDGRIYLLKVR